MNTMRRMLFVTLVSVFLFTGCASRKSQPSASFTFPEIGSVSTKGVGENLVTQGTGKLEPLLVIFQDEMIDIHNIRKGEYVFEAENATRIKFVKDGKEIFLYKAENKICVSKDLCSAMKYSLESKLGKKSVNSFQQTLLYNGKIGNRIAIGYREFSSDMARTAFSNEVAYDLSESTIIGYKGARIDIVKATNTEITYKVLSGFD